MKKVITRIFIGIATLIFLLIVASNFLPSTFSVTRSQEVKAPVEKVYQEITNLETWEFWAPFSIPEEKDVEIIYSQTSSDRGASKIWTLQKEGKDWTQMVTEEIGWIKIRNTEVNSSLNFEYTMDKARHLVEGTIQLDELGNNTRISWTFTGRFRKQPIEKYMGLWVDDLLGKRIENTLNGLDAYCQKQ